MKVQIQKVYVCRKRNLKLDSKRLRSAYHMASYQLWLTESRVNNVEAEDRKIK